MVVPRRFKADADTGVYGNGIPCLTSKPGAVRMLPRGITASGPPCSIAEHPVGPEGIDHGPEIERIERARDI